MNRWPGRALAAVGAGAAVLALAACGGGCDATSSASSNAAASGGGGSSAQLALVGYSTPKKAYDALTAAFSQSATGKGVGFTESFGASGSQSRAVDAGQ